MEKLTSAQIKTAVASVPDWKKKGSAITRTFLNVAPPEVLDKFQKRLPHAIQLTTYGGTEGGPVTMVRRDDPLQTRLQRPIHLPGPALADQLEQLVAGDAVAYLEAAHQTPSPS